MTDQQDASQFHIPPKIETKITPAVNAFAKAAFAKYKQRIAELENQAGLLADQLQKSTPRNSSDPPSFEHSHAEPERNPLPGRNVNRAA